MAEKGRDSTEYPEHNTARDEQTDPQDAEQTLQDNMIGMKATAEGTAGEDGEPAPTGDAAREGKARGQS